MFNITNFFTIHETKFILGIAANGGHDDHSALGALESLNSVNSDFSIILLQRLTQFSRLKKFLT